MNKIMKFCYLVCAGLIILILAVSVVPMNHSQAQDEDPQDTERISGDLPAVSLNESLDAVSSHLQIAGAALRPENSADVEWAVPVLNTVGCIYAESGDPNGYWNAPIYPPQGATLTKLQVYVYDASSTASAFGGIGIVDAYGNIVYGYGSYSAGDGGYSFFEVGIPNHQVDYVSYSYLLWWQPREIGTNMKVCGFRLFFVPSTTFLPLIEQNK